MHGEKIPQGRRGAEGSGEFCPRMRRINANVWRVDLRVGPSFRRGRAVCGRSVVSPDIEWLTIAGGTPAPHSKSPKLIGFWFHSRGFAPIRGQINPKLQAQPRRPKERGASRPHSENRRAKLGGRKRRKGTRIHANDRVDIDCIFWQWVR